MINIISVLGFLADLFSLISGLLAAFQSLMYPVRTARPLQGTSAQSGNWKEGKDERRRRERTTFISWPIQLSPPARESLLDSFHVSKMGRSSDTVFEQRT